jgi:hypothetical protein
MKKVRPSIDDTVINYYEKLMEKMKAKATKPQVKKEDLSYVG